MLLKLFVLLAVGPSHCALNRKFYIHDFNRPEAVDLFPPENAKLLPFSNASEMIFSERYAANEGFGGNS